MPREKEKLAYGVYEQIVNKDLKEGLKEFPEQDVKTEIIEETESSLKLSQYLSAIIRRTLEGQEDVKKRVRLSNEVIELLAKKAEEPALSEKKITEETEEKLLTEIREPIRLVEKKNLRPLSSLTHSALFTGNLELPLVQELKREIACSDRIDMLVSFVKVSGISMIREDLKTFSQRGGKLRVLSTTYMGATDAKAIKELSELDNAEIHISYDTRHTRLHAKAYMFYRNTGFNTAYIGSSNLSNAAITDGREWNMKITNHDQRDVFEKMKVTFDAYWSDTKEFEPYKAEDEERLNRAIDYEKYKVSGEGGTKQTFFSFDIRPYPFQESILDKLEAEREVHGHFKNLVVAATGTGKTVISAFDYKRFCGKNPGKANRLLFVAHRREILTQSLDCFRGVLKDRNFGDLFVGTFRPKTEDHLFVSIQTFNSQKLDEHFPEAYFDFIIVDEFHHAAAESYQRLLSYFRPKILLALTATPERMDGKDILSYFDGHRISAEIRLPEAIDRQLLCPFHYFGLTDSVDLSSVKWSRGGYDRTELSNVYSLSGSISDSRARMVCESVPRFTGDQRQVKGLGFCVSVEHARYMADFFQNHGIPSIALSSGSPETERNTARKRLQEGEIRFIFVVDLYNEGVDIPEINTVLFLRPTESLTVFLQQLGRGLRIAHGKECLTVLDFIGQANRKYNFEEKFSAMLEKTTHSVKSEIEEGFVSVPRGCYIHLERIAREIVLKNIRAALGQRGAMIDRIHSFHEESGLPLSLSNFLSYNNLDAKELYKWDSFSRLCVEAGVRENFSEDLEDLMRNAFPKLAALDSRHLIDFLLKELGENRTLQTGRYTETRYSEKEKAYLQMLLFTIWPRPEAVDVHQCLVQLNRCPVLKAELIELLEYRKTGIDFIDEPVDIGSPNPLDLFCTYSRDQILSGLGYFKPDTVRQGVFYIREKKCDVFFITLNKSEKEFSATTLYDDYAIDEYHFHWQSQSTTGEDSITGRRYRNHWKENSRVLLFVRDNKKDSFGNASPYTFIGKGTYVSHTGSKPMSIVWKLDRPIPARFIRNLSRSMVI